ncbi:uncharacterized protein LOC141602840 [Silene latifolia]|uniref:uncharacterized protein LOC141602840 n=1 Tax=Silene latifolia TaxID=37657 RepID=UPI003D781268
MGVKTLELTLISAKDLKNVNLIGKMDVYVVVHLSDQPKSKQKTPVHQDGGTHPSWNYTMRFAVDEADAAKPGKFVVFQLKHEHTFGADKDLGEVMVPVRELFDSVGKDPTAPQFLTYQVKTSSGKAKGELKFSFKFIDVAQNAGYGAGGYNPGQSCSSSAGGSNPNLNPYPPAAGYPPPSAGAYPPPGQAPYPPPGHAPAGYPMPQQAPMGYPPQSQGQPGVPYAAPQGYPPAGYGYPPQGPGGYGYPPQGPGGYGYPPQQYPPAGYGSSQKPQKPKKNKNGGFGMGMGAGLLGGAIGGLVLGEVIEDSFDGGFDDGGFDF